MFPVLACSNLGCLFLYLTDKGNPLLTVLISVMIDWVSWNIVDLQLSRVVFRILLKLFAAKTKMCVLRMGFNPIIDIVTFKGNFRLSWHAHLRDRISANVGDIAFLKPEIGLNPSPNGQVQAVTPRRIITYFFTEHDPKGEKSRLELLKCQSRDAGLGTKQTGQAP